MDGVDGKASGLCGSSGKNVCVHSATTYSVVLSSGKLERIWGTLSGQKCSPANGQKTCFKLALSAAEGHDDLDKPCLLHREGVGTAD